MTDPKVVVVDIKEEGALKELPTFALIDLFMAITMELAERVEASEAQKH